MEDLRRKPAVSAKTEGRDILVLHCRGCSGERGGKFELKFLYNGITMSYKSLKLEFRYNGKQGHWDLYAEKIVVWLR